MREPAVHGGARCSCRFLWLSPWIALRSFTHSFRSNYFHPIIRSRTCRSKWACSGCWICTHKPSFLSTGLQPNHSTLSSQSCSTLSVLVSLTLILSLPRPHMCIRQHLQEEKRSIESVAEPLNVESLDFSLTERHRLIFHRMLEAENFPLLSV